MHTTSLTIKNRLTCKLPVKSHRIKKKLGVLGIRGEYILRVRQI